MFFIMGINQRQKKLDFDQLIVCNRCGRYGHVEVFMVYTCLSLFFIPVFRWGKRYLVRTNCCDNAVEISRELGRKIANGEISSLPEDIIPLSDRSSGGWQAGGRHCCGSCGFETDEDYQFCPKCGVRF